MEIITGVERRRRWRLEEKLRIVAEVEQPGASFAAVARRHELSRGLLWNWRARVRNGALAPEPMPVFMPVRITGDTRPWATLHLPMLRPRCPALACRLVRRRPPRSGLRSRCRTAPASGWAQMSAWWRCAG